MSVSMIDEDAVASRFFQQRAWSAEPADARTIGPREVYALFRRRWRLIGAIVVLGLAISVIGAYEIPKTYTARSMLLLEPDDPNLLDDAPEATAQTPSRTKMDTETDLVTSRVFLGRVVDDQDLLRDPDYNSYLPKTGEGEGEGEGRGLVSRIAGFFGAGEEAQALAPVAVQRDRAISALLARLSVTRAGESQAMTISIQDDEAERAAALANAVTQLFVAWARESKQADARDAVAFLRGQAGDLAANIAATERQIAEYGRQNDVSGDPRDDLLRAAMQQANEQLSTARGDLAQAQSRLAQVRKEAAGTAQGEDPLLSSDFLTSLRNDEALALRERAQLARNFGAAHPQIQEADARIGSVRRLIGEEMGRISANLENDVRVAEGRVEQYRTTLAESGEELRGRGIAEIRLRELNRDLLTEQKLYDVVTGRLGKLDPYADIAGPRARVISTAEVPVEPSFPKIRILVAGGLIGSLILGFLAAMTLESLDTRLRSTRRAAELLRAPVLAAIPELPRRLLAKAPSVFDHLVSRPRSPVAESFRSLYHACRRLNAGRRDQMVMVTSALPLDGKTSTAIGLSTASAADGLRTVLVDLDLCTSRLGEALHLDETLPTLEDYLRGRVPLHDILQTVPGVPDLHVVNSAAHHGDVAGILRSDQIELLLAALRAEYDMVVVDAPPLLVVEDAVAIAAHVDSVVVAAAFDRTGEDRLREAGERLRFAGAPVAGVVVNRVDPALGEGLHLGSRAHRRQMQRYFAA